MKDKTVATYLSLLLGWVGVHKFYLGQYALGAAYLLFFWTYIPLIMSLVEFFILLGTSEDKFSKQYNSVTSRRNIQGESLDEYDINHEKAKFNKSPKDEAQYQPSPIMPNNDLQSNDNESYFLEIAKRHIQSGQLAEALVLIEQVINFNSQNAYAYTLRAVVYTNRDQSKVASDLTIAIDLYKQQGEYEIAEGISEKLSKSEGIRISNEFNRQGSEFYEKKQWQLAMEAFTRAIEYFPSNYRAYFNRSKIHFEEGFEEVDFRAAFNDLTKVIDMDARIGGAYHNRAVIYWVEFADMDNAVKDAYSASSIYYAENDIENMERALALKVQIEQSFGVK